MVPTATISNQFFFTQIVAVGNFFYFRELYTFTQVKVTHLTFAGSGPGLERSDAFLGHSCSAGGH